MTSERISLDDLEAWAQEVRDDHPDALRTVALIHWVNDLAGFKF